MNDLTTTGEDELALLRFADERARAFVAGAEARPAYPGAALLAALERFDEPLPDRGRPASETLALMDEAGSPAAVASNGPNYFGFVIGATLPAAHAAERLALAWDQCAATPAGGPSAHAIETRAAAWLLEILDLPRESAVGFGTSATACGLTCIAAARNALLAREGWDVEEDGLRGAPPVRVVVSDRTHVTIRKILRVLGFGRREIVEAPTDAFARVDPARLPSLDGRTILCLQAGEVNTGEFDPFAAIVPRAREAGAWTHVDGAFGLWARAASASRELTDGVEGADSWTTDGHKWLQTPYDGAFAICREPAHLARVMRANADYAAGAADAQMNVTLEFSRRARGIAAWAALRTLGRDGVDEMVTRHRRLARRIADGLRAHGYEVLNRVVLNQVLARCATDGETEALVAAAQASGEAWFGASVWEGRPAFRISVSSWRTQDAHADRLVALLGRLRS